MPSFPKPARKEPNERYSSADALREDVVAWLEHRPVKGSPGRLVVHCEPPTSTLLDSGDSHHSYNFRTS